MENLIKLKSDMSAEKALPFIAKICKMDGLHECIIRDFNWALAKFRMILLICEQNGLQYWVNRDFRIANLIYDRSLDFRTNTKPYDITKYQN